MRKPRDFDAELKALDDRAKDSRRRRCNSWGNSSSPPGRTHSRRKNWGGALIVLAETKEAGKRQAWAKRGAAFFQGRTRPR